MARWGQHQYRLWFWPLAPHRCGGIRDLASASGGSATLRNPVRKQTYGLPASADPDVIEFLSSLSSIDMPGEVRCTVPKGRVIGRGVIVSPDGQSLARDVSVVFGGTPDDHPLLHSQRVPPARRMRGRTLNVASAGGESYYHWLIDELPRFLEAASEKSDAVIGHKGHLSRVAELVGFGGRLVEVYRPRHYQCDELAVGSLFGISGHPTSEAAESLRNFATQYGLRAAHAGRRRRIFVTRAATRVRQLVRESEIWSRLESRGFERLFLEKMSWDEQIAAFSAAEVVVAPHGAGLANLVFCQPGTRVIELFDRRYLHWCYWQLASVSGLEYHAVVSEGDAPPTHDVAHLGTHIDISWGRLPPGVI